MIIPSSLAKELGDKPILGEEPEPFGNPPKDVQENFVGLSFEAAYSEAVAFLNSALDGLNGEIKILDFGCGWGRMLRVLRSTGELKDVQLYGCDPQLWALDLCKRAVPNVCLMKTGLLPPTDFRDGAFDLIYAFSVFSHLSPASHMAWAKELGRLTRRGGRVCVTTFSRNVLQICESLRNNPPDRALSKHETRLAASFTAPDSLAKYDRGEFLYEPIKEPPWSGSYGEAVVPRRVFERDWARFGFKLIKWDDHPETPGGQPIVTLQRR